MPLNNFFGEFIRGVKLKKIKQIEEMLKKQPDEFYGSVDEMGKSALHVACEKNVLELVKLVLDTLFPENKGMKQLRLHYRCPRKDQVYR
jgi:hypothetical protein